MYVKTSKKAGLLKGVIMKLIEWNCFNEIEAYTTCREDDGHIMNMSFNGIDDQQVLENRQRLAKTLHSDLSTNGRHFTTTHYTFY